MAGTASARDNTSDVVGAAPGAKLTGVKVLGCNGSGSTSGVIKGIDWVTSNVVKPAVANMSLGGGVSTTLDNAVVKSANSGVFYALAAGNSGADACNSSPARAGAGTNDGIMTVAATDSAEREAAWGNYGKCVDIWAPGVSILSTRRGGGTTTMSGTSMASPHVAGGGALCLSSHTGSSPAMVEWTLEQAATTPGTNSKDGRTITRLYVGGFSPALRRNGHGVEPRSTTGHDMAPALLIRCKLSAVPARIRRSSADSGSCGSGADICA